jgi:hypothetical protein
MRANVMQLTADFHDEIAGTDLAEAAGVVDDARMTAGDVTIRRFLRARECAATRFYDWRDHLDVREYKREEPKILKQLTARG